MTAKAGSGGDGVAVDPATVERFLLVGAEEGRALAFELERTTRLDDAVRSTWFGPAPDGVAIADAGRLLSAWADHDGQLARWLKQVSQADDAGALAGTGAGGTIPWLDPDSDSWVVDLAGAGRGSPDAVNRLRRDLPGVLQVLGGATAELNLFHQADLALNDRRRLLANWSRFGRGALDAFGGLVQLGVGAMAVTSPGLDDSLSRLTGRRPGAELVDGLRGAGSLAIHDPDRLVEAQLGWDDLQQDPYHWLGGFTPDVILELATLGGGGLAARGPRMAVQALDEVEDAAGTGRAIGHLADPDPAPGLPDLARFRQGEPEWAEAGPIVSHREAPFESPEQWVDDINGEGLESSGRSVNCVDCTRAVEANWRGQDAVAAPLKEEFGRGTTARRLEEWSGGELVPTTLDDLAAQLDELGPGSSALIVSDWKGTSGAHAYNAVNDAGVVKWVDAQSGAVAPWPPAYADSIDRLAAIFIGPDGEPR